MYIANAALASEEDVSAAITGIMRKDIFSLTGRL
jgi:hypothetical protein